MAAPVNTGCPTTVISDMARQPDGFWQQGIAKLPEFAASFWWNFLPKGRYPVGQGAAPRKFLANRYYGSDFNVWSPVAPSNGTGSAGDNAQAFLPPNTPQQANCCPNIINLVDGFNGQTFRAVQVQVQSKPICQTDLLASFEPMAEVQMRVEQYGQQVERIQSSESRNEFIRLCQRKIYMTPGTGTGGMYEDATVGDPNATTIEAFLGLNNNVWPVSYLQQQLLDFIAQQFYFERIPGVKTVDATPVYPLLSDSFTLHNLVRQDDSIREDVRFADMGEGDYARLLQGINIQRAFRGFAHIQDMALHFTRVASADAAWQTTWNSGTGEWTPVLEGGFWKYVPPYQDVLTTSGYTQDQNPAWATAPYVLSIVPTDQVVEESVPPLLDIPSQYRVARMTDYIGTMKFIALNTPQDPLALQGSFFGYMIRGFQPLWNKRGATIMHLNCNTVPLRNCAGYAYGE